jgi:hypothetical protein
MNFECVEIYVPKKLENMSKLYAFLQQKLSERERRLPQDIPVEGFSLYEVDGAFYGHEIYQERTLVVRILFKRNETDDLQTVEQKVRVLGADVAATVAITEDELWVCHYPQNVVILAPRKMG